MMPLVSCLMLTYNRLVLFEKSFQYFLEQTYQNKELIIINSGDVEYKSKIEEMVKNHSNVKHIKVDREEFQSLGSLRNLSLENASGEYCMIFDDDDYHHSLRIEKQMLPILESNVDGTILKRVVLNNGRRRGNQSVEIMNGLEGTLLFKNPKGELKYDNMDKGEDSNFIIELKKMNYNILYMENDPSLYHYIFHGGNMVGENHFNRIMRRNRHI